MNKLLIAILAQSLGGLIVFFQLQGWVAWPDKPWMKSLWWMYATSLLIAPLFFIVPNGLMNISVHFGI